MPVASGAFKSFSEAGVSFDSILHDGMLGGLPAVKTYLQLRRKMLLRNMSQASSAGADPAKYIRAIKVIDQSVALLDLLGSTGPESGEPS